MNPDLVCLSKGILFWVNFAASHDFSQLSPVDGLCLSTCITLF